MLEDTRQMNLLEALRFSNSEQARKIEELQKEVERVKHQLDYEQNQNKLQREYHKTLHAANCDLAHKIEELTADLKREVELRSLYRGGIEVRDLPYMKNLEGRVKELAGELAKERDRVEVLEGSLRIKKVQIHDLCAQIASLNESNRNLSNENNQGTDELRREVKRHGVILGKHAQKISALQSELEDRLFYDED